MNRLKNQKIVNQLGDSFQLEFGTEFGYYAKTLTKEDVSKFCDEFNLIPWVQYHGYMLSSKFNYSGDIFCVAVRHFARRFHIQTKLLDHSVYLFATDEEWLLIEDEFFKLLTTEWRKFLCENVQEYSENLDKTLLVTSLQP